MDRLVSVWTCGYLFQSMGYNVILSLHILSLKLLQLWPLGVPPNWLLCSSDMTPIIFQHILYFLAPQDVLIMSYTFPAAGLESIASARSLGSFNQETLFRTNTWALGGLTATELSLLLGSLSRQSRETYACAHVCISLSVPLYIY